MLQSFYMRGGPHDGVSVDPPSVDGGHPETLFAISFKSGEAYARVGEQLEDQTGTSREIFDFDADGALTARARQQFAPLVND